VSGEAGAGAARRRVLGWLGGRIVVATLLLGGVIATQRSDEPGLGFSRTALIGLVIATYAASLGSLLALRGGGGAARVARVQPALDLALATALVWLLGGVGSGFSFLYGTSTLAAAVVLGPRAARATAAWAVVLYVTTAVTVSGGWLPAPPDQPTAAGGLAAPDVGLALLRTVLGLALVGVLSGFLAERLQRAGGELRAATERAARLAALNVDIVRSLPAGLLTVDPEGRIASANPAAHAILGAEEGSLVGRPALALLPALADARADLDVERVGPVLRREGEGRRIDGAPFPIGYTRTALRSADGAPFGELVVFQDLSEINALRAQAERAERLAQLGRMAAGLAHEIRNPLSSITGSVQLVHDAPGLGEEDRRLLANVAREVRRLDELVDTMLAVGKPRPPQRAPHDVARIAADVAKLASAGLGESAGVSIEVDAPDGEVVVDVDADQLRQVLWNLVKNGVQASRRGQRVRVVVRRDEGGGCTLEVRDEGQGIAREALGRVFDPFVTTRSQGTGLGLALVRQIAEAHRADLRVESEEGAGATFRLRFPGREAAPG
jgi:two-component system sensor histidine kinase PilS (NtrC family)